jgi:glycosyltransferase involved in cell wall biosynthesis
VIREAVFAVPGDLGTPTGGYTYDRHIIAELKRLGWHVAVVDLGDGFPNPGAETLHVAERRLAATPADAILIIDGLALGIMPQAAAAIGSSHKVVALVHHPLAFESGLSDAQRRVFHASEKSALDHVRRIVVTSDATMKLLMSDYDVSGERIAVVRPGNDRVEMAQGSGGGFVSLLAVGAIVPRKGYDVLIAALATLKDLPWRLTIAGDRDRDPQAAAQLDADIATHGFSGRVIVTGAVPAERLAALYRGADIFVLASRFEGYGMAFAEAVAYGLPVVGTNAGAIPEAVPAAASVLVAPGDAHALAAALRRVIEGRGERERLAFAARAAARSLPTWEDAGRLFAQAIEIAA